MYLYFPVDQCTKNPCNSGGNCTVTGSDSYSCQCVEGFYGDNCEKGIWVGVSFKLTMVKNAKPNNNNDNKIYLYSFILIYVYTFYSICTDYQKSRQNYLWVSTGSSR